MVTAPAAEFPNAEHVGRSCVARGRCHCRAARSGCLHSARPRSRLPSALHHSAWLGLTWSVLRCHELKALVDDGCRQARALASAGLVVAEVVLSPLLDALLPLARVDDPLPLDIGE